MIEALAPGSVMLLGEHAVLHQQPAMVAAVDKTITVRLLPTDDAFLSIKSALGKTRLPMDQLSLIKPFEFIIAAVKFYLPKIQTGLSIEVDTEFSHEVGLGSSAAVTVALIAALQRLLHLPFDRQKIFETAKSVILSVQGLGSGADVAASTFGGLLYYYPAHNKIKKMVNHPDITLCYCGYKTPTHEVIQIIEKQFESRKEALETYYEEIGQLVDRAYDAAQESKWSLFAQYAENQQIIMESMGLNTPELETCRQRLKQFDEIYGVKISGSGLGDCVVGIGQFEKNRFESFPDNIAVSIINQGVQVDG